MCQYVSNVYFPAIEVHRSDDSIVVASNVEDYKTPDSVSTRKRGAQLVKSLKVAAIHDLEPS